MSNKSLILVILQFGIFVYFLLSGQIIAKNFWILMQIAGFIISVWGIIAMKIGNFNVQPEVKATAIFITKGPYKIIRNPMYAGLILFFGASVISSFSFLRIGILIILILVFLVKIKMEEKFLSQKFGEEYLIFKKKTYRLIPFIF